ncbi:hypothetical protein H7Y29_01730, partial [Microbacteriaceae bacterium]|nr:hypothetical protein [Candidatus Saccharibacteria bacterium]
MNMNLTTTTDNPSLNKLKKTPWGYSVKPASYQQMTEFFDVMSAADLRYTLYELAAAGFIYYTIRLCPAYLVWEQSYMRAIYDTSPLLPPPGMFSVRRSKYITPTISGADIRAGKPLSARQVD